LGKLRENGGDGYRRRDPTINGTIGNKKNCRQTHRKITLNNTAGRAVLRQPFSPHIAGVRIA